MNNLWAHVFIFMLWSIRSHHTLNRRLKMSRPDLPFYKYVLLHYNIYNLNMPVYYGIHFIQVWVRVVHNIRFSSTFVSTTPHIIYVFHFFIIGQKISRMPMLELCSNGGNIPFQSSIIRTLHTFPVSPYRFPKILLI